MAYPGSLEEPLEIQELGPMKSGLVSFGPSLAARGDWKCPMLLVASLGA